MNRRLFLLAGVAAVAGCAHEPPRPALGADGKPLPKLYRIRQSMTADVQFRFLDGVNAFRSQAGLGELTLNANLNAAAATHSRDMSIQNRPWHFGSDGSSPVDRVARAGYTGRLIGENLSETFETELGTLAAWMAQADTRAVVMNAEAIDLGFSWYQEVNGKIWWTMITGNPVGRPAPTLS